VFQQTENSRAFESSLLTVTEQQKIELINNYFKCKDKDFIWRQATFYVN